MYIFDMDNPVWRFIGRLVDLVWLNILTLVCCIPIITIGASISAMYRVLIRITMDEEGALTKGFFKSFKENFKNATMVWIPSMLIILVMASNAYLLLQGILDGNKQLFVAVGISISIILIAVFMFLTYSLSIMGRYENTLKQTVKNAGLMMLAYFPRSICMVIISIFPIALMLLHDNFLIFWFLYGISFPGYINAMLLGSIFQKTESINGMRATKEEDDSEDGLE